MEFNSSMLRKRPMYIDKFIGKLLLEYLTMSGKINRQQEVHGRHRSPEI